MSGPFVAGIDVGNSTTEVVVADVSARPPRPVAWDRRPTVGRKGSERSIVAAAELLVRLEARAGVRASEVVVTPQRPVDTSAAVLPEPAPDTGRLRLLAAGGATPGAAGVGAGRPVRASDAALPGSGPVVLVSEDPLGYRATVADVARWTGAGADVVGVLVAGDEAVLVSRRLAAPLPVVDRADTATALAARLVALEVAPAGAPVRALTDPVRLAALLGLGPEEHRDAEALARSVRGVGDLAVALMERPEEVPAPSAAGAWAEDADGVRRDLLGLVASGEWDGVRRIAVPGAGDGLDVRDVEDVWSVDLDAVASDVVLRAGAARTRAVALAALARAEAPVADLVSTVARVTGRPVRVVADEASAARAGALTTPGADAGATVLDVGGGTVDVVRTDGSSRVLAGAGDLVTLAAAELLGIPRGQAEWVKRGPCSRVESPHVVAGEDGRRRFLDDAAPTGSVGRLVVPGPAGPLPFSATLAPAEWRALRLRLKSAVLGDNVRRATGAGGGAAPEVRGDVVVVGGPAGDDEVLDALARALPSAVPGRGDAAGVLGHRWAVAYGLVVLAATS